MRCHCSPNFPRRRAMTFAELVLGMGMTAMVMAALGSAWYAVGRQWEIQGGSQNVALTASQAVARIETVLRASRFIFQFNNTTATATDRGQSVTVDSGSVFFWGADNWLGVSDGAVQIGEMALIEHDAQAARVYLYRCKPYAKLDSGQRSRASGVTRWSDLSSSLTLPIFKSYDFVERVVIGEAVRSIRWNVAPATRHARPVVEYTVTVSRPAGDLVLYGAAALRGPATRPR